MADRTDFEKLQGAIVGNKELQGRLNDILTRPESSEQDRHAALGDFARQVAADNLNKGMPPSFDPSRVVASFTATQQPTSPQQQGDALTQQGQQGQGVLASAIKGAVDQQHEQHIVRYDTAAPSIQSEQQYQLLQEYEQALTIENTAENPEAREDAIRKILAKLDAQSLLKEQINQAKKYLAVETYTKDKSDKEKQQNHLDEAKKRILGLDKDDKKIQGVLGELDKNRANEANLSQEEKEGLAKRRAQEHSLETTAITAADKEKAREAFQKLLVSRQEEAARYNYFQEMASEKNQEDAYIYGIVMAISAAQSARQKQQAEEERGHAEEGLSGMQQQEQQRQNLATQAFNLGRGAQSAKGGAARSLARQGFSQLLNKAKQMALKKAAQFILTQPEILIPILIAVGVLLLILVIIIAVIALVIYITSQSTSSGPGGTPQNVAALVSVAEAIQTCERTRYGFHAPSPSCVTALNLPGSYGSEVQGFVNAVNRGYADFQCGQYIWAAQKYVLNWAPFPGNVATVYNWYTIHANHTLQGYNWIPNPDNPAWGNSSAPANILPGDIILYGSVGGSDPGHIAIVTTVQSDSFNFVVTEANYHQGAIDLRPTNLHDGLGRGAYILGWWRRQ